MYKMDKKDTNTYKLRQKFSRDITGNIQMPIMVMHQGRPVAGEHSDKAIHGENEFGCYYIGLNGTSKVAVNSFIKNVNFPLFKPNKDGKEFFFQLASSNDIQTHNYQETYLILQYNLKTNEIMLQVNSLNLDVNFIFFILHSAALTFDELEKLLKRNAPPDLVILIDAILAVAKHNYDYLFYSQVSGLSTLSQTSESQKFNSQFKSTVEMKIKEVLPHMQEYSLTEQGHFLLEILKMFLYALVTTTSNVNVEDYPMGAFPDSDNLCKHRIRSSAALFEKALRGEINNWRNKLPSILETYSNTHSAYNLNLRVPQLNTLVLMLA